MKTVATTMPKTFLRASTLFQQIVVLDEHAMKLVITGEKFTLPSIDLVSTQSVRRYFSSVHTLFIFEKKRSAGGDVRGKRNNISAVFTRASYLIFVSFHLSEATCNIS
jgi:hypothetical protein